jgi:membrane-associated protein
VSLPFEVPDLLTPLIEVGRPWLQSHGLLGVALCLFAETFFFTGMWFPGMAVVVAAGYLAGLGELPTALALAAAWAGAAGGDHASYFLGRFWGSRLLRRKQAAARRVRLALEREGTWLLLAYHYAPPLRALLPCVAGSTRFPVARWLLYDTTGALLWVGLLYAFGYLAAGALRQGSNLALHLMNTALLAVVLYLLWRVCRAAQAADSEMEEGEEQCREGASTNLPLA